MVRKYELAETAELLNFVPVITITDMNCGYNLRHGFTVSCPTCPSKAKKARAGDYGENCDQHIVFNSNICI